MVISMNKDSITNIINKIKENSGNHNQAYTTLICYGTAEKEYDNVYHDYSEEWQQYFSNVRNIECDPNAMFGFCSFKNGMLAADTINQIKLYVPLDKKHIKEGVMRIFRFLAYHNITHSSKVRNGVIRNDNIVIRLGSKEDAKKVTSFIRQDEYLQESQISANPFMVNDGKIGLACDGLYSYNSVITDLIIKYLNETTEETNCNSFKQWIENWYRETFLEENKDNLESLKNLGSHNYIYGFNKLNAEAIMTVNIKQIAELLILSLDETRKIREFYKYYEEITDEQNYRKSIKHMENYIKKIRNIEPETMPNEETIAPQPLRPKIEIPFTYEEFITMEKELEEEKFLEELKQINIVREDKEFAYNFLAPKEKIKILRKKEQIIREELEHIKKYNNELTEIKEEIIFEIMSFSDEKDINKKLEEEGLIIQKRIELQNELEELLKNIREIEDTKKERIINSEHQKRNKKAHAKKLAEAKNFFSHLSTKTAESYDIKGLNEEELLDLYHFFKTNPLGRKTYEETNRKIQNEALDHYFQKKTTSKVKRR